MLEIYLHPGSPLLSYVVSMHDIQNLVPDSLCITTTPTSREHHSGPLLSFTPCLAMHLECRTPGVSIGAPTRFSRILKSRTFLLRH